MRPGDPVPSPRDPHHREPRWVDDVGVVAVGHERQPPGEEPAQPCHARRRLELDPRLELDAEELGGREGLGEDHLGVGGKDLVGEGVSLLPRGGGASSPPGVWLASSSSLLSGRNSKVSFAECAVVVAAAAVVVASRPIASPAPVGDG